MRVELSGAAGPSHPTTDQSSGEEKISLSKKKKKESIIYTFLSSVMLKLSGGPKGHCPSTCSVTPTPPHHVFLWFYIY